MLKYFSFTVLVGSLNKSISLILFVRKSMYLMCNYKLYNNFIAFSRIERERNLIPFRRREKSRFFVKPLQIVWGAKVNIN